MLLKLLSLMTDLCLSYNTVRAGYHWWWL